jgi:hypothetical protein
MLGRSGRGAVALAFAFVLGACGVEEWPAEAVTAQAVADGSCGAEVCGSNSPEVDLLGFHDLSLVGIPNVEGFVIETRNGLAQIQKGALSYNLHVSGGIITGTRLLTPILSGTQLIGAFIPIFNVNTRKRYQLVIRGVSPMTYFVPPTSPPPAAFEAYSLTWRAPPSDFERSLCNNIEGLRKLRSRDPEQAQWELMGLSELQSVIFEGDKIYTLPKTMEKLPDDSWINIGCAGHTLAKLFLTRNTVHSQRPGILRPWEQRQATFKFLVSDICGTGQPFTSFGERVVWKGDLMQYFETPDTFEGRWTENGAKCIHKPRMEEPSTELGASLFKDIWGQIRKVCDPVLCVNLDVNDFQGAYRNSGNP